MHEDAERKISKVSDLAIARGCVLIRQRHVMLFAFVPKIQFILYVCESLKHIIHK